MKKSKKKNRRQGKNIVVPTNYDNIGTTPKLDLIPLLDCYTPPEPKRPRVAIVASPMSSSELRALESIFNRHGVTVILPDRSTN